MDDLLLRQLTQLRQRIKKGNWTQYAYDDKVGSYCLMGHIHRNFSHPGEQAAVRDFIQSHLPKITIEEFNDNYCDNVGDVQMFLDKVIDKRRTELAILTNS